MLVAGLRLPVYNGSDDIGIPFSKEVSQMAECSAPYDQELLQWVLLTMHLVIVSARPKRILVVQNAILNWLRSPTCDPDCARVCMSCTIFACCGVSVSASEFHASVLRAHPPFLRRTVPRSPNTVDFSLRATLASCVWIHFVDSIVHHTFSDTFHLRTGPVRGRGSGKPKK